MAPKLTPRLRVLRTLEKEPHRYPRIRHYTMALTFAVLYAVPLLGLARFDLWDGRHMAAGSRTNFVYGFGAVFLSIVAFYLMTFVVNGIVGRLFCGFGCPVGHASRMGDSVEVARRSGDKRLLPELSLIGYSLALGGAAWLWVVDPRVFLEGTPKAILYATLGLVGITGVVYVHSRFIGWSLCRGYCPIGIYYSAIRTAHSFGIHYDEVEGTCKGCDYCVQACPVGLNPRDLEKPLNDVIGVAIEGFPEANHCLTCGECVRACENVLSHKPELVVPLRLARGQDRHKAPGEAPTKKRKLPVRPAAESASPAADSPSAATPESLAPAKSPAKVTPANDDARQAS